MAWLARTGSRKKYGQSAYHSQLTRDSSILQYLRDIPDSRHDKHKQAIDTIDDEGRSRSLESTSYAVEPSAALVQEGYDETQHGMEEGNDSAED